MRLSVTGSRHWTDRAKVYATLDAIDPRPSAIIHGGSHGVDEMADDWAKERAVIRIRVRPARDGVASDYILRNFVIVDLGDQTIAFRAAGKSNGTDATVGYARKVGKLIGVVEP